MAPLKVAPAPERPAPAPVNFGQLYTSAYEKVSASEFSKLTRDECRSIFSEFDLDLNGYIDVSELKKHFEKQFGDQEVRDQLQQICSQADSSGDGLIDVEELYQALCLNVDAEPFKRVLRGAEEKKDIWVKRSDILGFLQDQQQVIESCASLPFYAIFFTLSFLLVWIHMEIGEKFQNLSAVKSNFADLEEHVSGWKNLDGDFVPWFSDEFMPLVGMDLAENPGRIQTFNQIIGGVKVTTTRLDGGRRCHNLNIDKYFDVHVRAKNANLCLLPRSDENEDPLVTDENWFLLKHGANKLRELTDARVPANKGWINTYTEKAEIQFSMYNAENGMFTVSNFQFQRNVFGNVEFSAKYETFSATPYDNGFLPTTFLMVMDAAFIVCVAYILFSEILEMVPILYRNGIVKGLSLYFTIWNVIDWFNIMMSIIIVCLYYFLVTSVGEVVKSLEKISPQELAACQESGKMCNPILPRLNDFNLISENVTTLYYSMRSFVFFFAISSMLSFFKAFRANPRLNVVQDTLLKSGGDLLHFGIVFISIFLAFVQIAYMQFGSELELFSTADKAIDTCFMMMLGFILDDVRDQLIATRLGQLWVILFFVVMQLLLFNMILAIIFDVYGEVKAQSGDAQDIVEQASEFFSDYREKVKKKTQEVRRKMRNTRGSQGRSQETDKKPKDFSDNKILQFLEEKGYHANDVVTADSLRHSFGSNLEMGHAELLVKQVDRKMRRDKMQSDIESEDILRLLGRVDRNLRDLRQEMNLHDTGSIEANAMIEEANRTPKSIFNTSQFPKPQASPEIEQPNSKSFTVINAKLKRLESYTAHRLDRVDATLNSLDKKIDRFLENANDDVSETEIRVKEVLEDIEPHFDGPGKME